MKRFFRQPQVRLVLVALGIVMFFLLQSTVVGAYMDLAIFFVLFGLMVWQVVTRTYRLGQSLRTPIIRFTFRLLRKVRKELIVPPAIQLLYVLSWIASMVVTIGLLLSKSPTSFDIGYLSVFSILAIAAFFDLLIRILRLMKKAWARTAGKVLLAHVGGAALLLALAMAKQQIHGLVRVDPKYFEDFARLLAVLYLPFVYVTIGVSVLSLFSIFQMVGVLIVLPASQVANFFSAFAQGSKFERDCRIFWYRIRWGKKPVELPGKTGMSLDDIRFFMRPLGTVALVATVFQLVSNSATYLPKTQTVVASVLVMTQYQSDSRCKGLVPGTRVVYLDRGNVSTATISGPHVVFGVEQCKSD